MCNECKNKQEGLTENVKDLSNDTKSFIAALEGGKERLPILEMDAEQVVNLIWHNKNNYAVLDALSVALDSDTVRVTSSTLSDIKRDIDNMDENQFMILKVNLASIKTISVDDHIDCVSKEQSQSKPLVKTIEDPDLIRFLNSIPSKTKDINKCIDAFNKFKNQAVDTFNYTVARLFNETNHGIVHQLRLNLSIDNQSIMSFDNVELSIDLVRLALSPKLFDYENNFELYEKSIINELNFSIISRLYVFAACINGSIDSEIIGDDK